MKINITLSRPAERVNGEPARDADGTLTTIAVAVAASYVNGVFAVHKLTHKGLSMPWELVHVPSGLRTGSFATLRDAKLVINALPQLGAKCTLGNTDGFAQGEMATLHVAYLEAVKLTSSK